jgi:hypothetical protein
LVGVALAAVLHAGVVVAFEAELGFEDKVVHFTAGPDEEGVALELRIGGGPAGEEAVFNRPNLLVAFPTCEIASVEELLEFFFGLGGFVGANGGEDAKREQGGEVAHRRGS